MTPEEIHLSFAPSTTGAYLCRGELPGPVTRAGWTAAVIPTLGPTANWMLGGMRLRVIHQVHLAASTRAEAIERLKLWAADNKYGRLEIVELADRKAVEGPDLLADLRRAVWPTPPPTFGPTQTKPKRHDLFL